MMLSITAKMFRNKYLHSIPRRKFNDKKANTKYCNISNSLREKGVQNQHVPYWKSLKMRGDLTFIMKVGVRGVVSPVTRYKETLSVLCVFE